MATLLDGRKVAEEMQEQIRGEVAQLYERHGIQPSLYAILVGEDPASQSYVRNKKKACERLGMQSTVHFLAAGTSQQDLEKLVHALNMDTTVHGILVQLPLPIPIDQHAIMDGINPSKDVDGFTSVNQADLYRGEAILEPCTPRGVLRLLDYYEISTEGKHIVVIGRSEIVGRPLAVMLSGKARNATVTLCHSKTRDLMAHTSDADIVVSAVGNPRYLSAQMVKEGAVVIDVGINRLMDPTARDGYRMVGDVDFEDVAQKAGYITPVPGGVGPMTIACLMENTLRACKIQNRLRL